MLSSSYLRKVLTYDPPTGIFRWREKYKNNRKGKGSIAGSPNGAGYIGICVDYKVYLAHRLAWLYVTGRWPTNFIDHINAIRDDNRFCNLREATNAQNVMNCKLYSSNTSGYSGVVWDKQTNKWIARIKQNGKYINLGRYLDKNDAIKTRRAASIALFGDFATF